jgi:hypothetical protein
MATPNFSHTPQRRAKTKKPCSNTRFRKQQRCVGHTLTKRWPCTQKGRYKGKRRLIRLNHIDLSDKLRGKMRVYTQKKCLQLQDWLLKPLLSSEQKLFFSRTFATFLQDARILWHCLSEYPARGPTGQEYPQGIRAPRGGYRAG